MGNFLYLLIYFRLLALEMNASANHGSSSMACIEPERKRYDVILLDLDMPIMDGYDACKRLRMSDKRGLL